MEKSRFGGFVDRQRIHGQSGRQVRHLDRCGETTIYTPTSFDHDDGKGTRKRMELSGKRPNGKPMPEYDFPSGLRRPHPPRVSYLLGEAMKYSLRSLMIAVLVVPPLLAWGAVPLCRWLMTSRPSIPERVIRLWDKEMEEKYGRYTRRQVAPRFSGTRPKSFQRVTLLSASAAGRMTVKVRPHGDPVEAEGRLLDEQDGIEYELGMEYFRLRGRS